MSALSSADLIGLRLILENAQREGWLPAMHPHFRGRGTQTYVSDCGARPYRVHAMSFPLSGSRDASHSRSAAITPFAYGFRPFFLAAIAYGLVTIILWLAIRQF